MTTAARAGGGRWRMTRIGGARWRRGREGEMYATAIITVLISCARILCVFVRGGAGSGHAIPGNVRSWSLARGQPTPVRERSAAECGRAGPGGALRDLEQSADQNFRHLHHSEGVPLGRHDLPPSAPSHRRRKNSQSRLPPDLVPDVKRRMEDQELTQPRGSAAFFGRAIVRELRAVIGSPAEAGGSYYERTQEPVARQSTSTEPDRVCSRTPQIRLS